MTQCQLIRAALECGEVITPLDALTRFNCMALSQRISELEGDPYNLLIDHQWYKTPSGKKVMSYSLLKIPY